MYNLISVYFFSMTGNSTNNGTPNWLPWGFREPRWFLDLIWFLNNFESFFVQVNFFSHFMPPHLPPLPPGNSYLHGIVVSFESGFMKHNFEFVIIKSSTLVSVCFIKSLPKLLSHCGLISLKKPNNMYLDPDSHILIMERTRRWVQDLLLYLHCSWYLL